MTNLAWIDLETTGLEPDGDAILEIGVVITTKSLERVAFENWVVIPTVFVSLSGIDAYVLKMHADNGLWKESLSSELLINKAAKAAVEFIENHDAKGSPACGSSVHFDRAFLKQQVRLLDDAFHYRNIDVSTLRNLVEMYRPDIFETRPQGEKQHRAVGDLFDSIAELKHYATALGWRLS